MYSEMKKPLPEDIRKVLADPLNKKYQAYIKDEQIPMLCQDPYSAVAIINGEPVMIGGLVVYWDGRGRLWSMFTTMEKHKFIPVFRLMKKYVDNLKIRRIELDVPYHDNTFKRRAEMLGFTKYADRARSYNVFGEDCTLFERIN